MKDDIKQPDNKEVEEKPNVTSSRSNSENDITPDQENAIALENRKWRHRRRMSYICLIALILEVNLVFLFILLDVTLDLPIVERLNTLTGFLSTIAVGQVSLIGAYFGLSTWQERR